MTAVNCPEHGNLMRDLARGVLDDERALTAEAVRSECGHCGRWWCEAFACEAYERVDRALAESIADFAPPARRRPGWLAVAAAVVLAIGVGATSMLWRGERTSPGLADGVVSTWDFEAGTVESTHGAATEVGGRGERTGNEFAVFVSGLESGDLSAWSSHS